MDVSGEKLRQLVVVAKCGSFSRAAEELHMSQPALSRSIAAIEQRYGFRIFHRLGHGVEPTTAGLQVIAQARPALQALTTFDHNLKSLGAARSGVLSIGFSPLLASQVLAQIAAEFFTADVSAQIRVRIQPGPELLTELKDGAIEAFFFPDRQVQPSDDIEILAVGRFRPVCVVRREHPLAGCKSLTLSDLKTFPWASSVDPPFPADLLSPSRLICDNYHILRETVLLCDLVCIASEAFVSRELANGSLCELEILDLPLAGTDIHIAQLRGRISSPLAHLMVDRMRLHLGGSPPLRPKRQTG